MWFSFFCTLNSRDMFFDDTEREKRGSMLYHAFRIFECDDVSRGRLMKENCVRPLAQRRNYG